MVLLNDKCILLRFIAIICKCFFLKFMIVVMFVNVTPSHLDCSEFLFYLLILYILYFLLEETILALYLVFDVSKKILFFRKGHIVH